MPGKTKTPTASGISRLLSAAGFKRSERQIGGFGDGFVAEKIYSVPVLSASATASGRWERTATPRYPTSPLTPWRS